MPGPPGGAPPHAWPPGTPIPPQAPPPRRDDGTLATVLAVCGGLVTAIGMCFLLLTADDVLSPLVRVLVSFALAVVLLGIGVGLRGMVGSDVGPDALAATGIAGALLCVAAARGLDLLPVVAGMALTLLVTVAGLALAVWWDNQVIATVVVAAAALLGPFLDPRYGIQLVMLHVVVASCVAALQRWRTWSAPVVASFLPLTWSLTLRSLGGFDGRGADWRLAALAAVTVAVVVVSAALAQRTARRLAATRPAAPVAVPVPWQPGQPPPPPGAVWYRPAPVVRPPVPGRASDIVHALLVGACWPMIGMAAGTLGRHAAAGHLFLGAVAGVLLAVATRRDVTGPGTRGALGAVAAVLLGGALLGLVPEAGAASVLAGACVVAAVGSWLRSGELRVAAFGVGLLGWFLSLSMLAFALAGPARRFFDVLGPMTVGAAGLALVALLLLSLRRLPLTTPAAPVAPGAPAVPPRPEGWPLVFAALAGAWFSWLLVVALATWVGQLVGATGVAYATGQVLVVVAWLGGVAYSLHRSLADDARAGTWRGLGAALAAVSVAKLALVDVMRLSGSLRILAFVAIGLVLIALAGLYARAAGKRAEQGSQRH